MGDSPLDLNAAASRDRVLSDSFSEDWPPLKIYDLGKAPGGDHRAVGSQLDHQLARGFFVTGKGLQAAAAVVEGGTTVRLHLDNDIDVGGQGAAAARGDSGPL